MPRITLIRLGTAHFAVLLSGIVMVLAVCWIVMMPSWEYLYLREVAIPRLEQKYGFNAGMVTFRSGSDRFDAWGIVSVAPDGELARLGVRAGDVPTAYHGGMSAMYHALESAERKRFAAFDVVNADDGTGRQSNRPRTIVAYPRGTEVPIHFRWEGGESIAPTQDSTLVSLQPQRSQGSFELWIRDLTTGGAVKLYSYRTHVAVVWSTDGRWLALTDYDGLNTRCVVLDPRGVRFDVAELIARLPAVARLVKTEHTIGCEVFGWIHGTPHVAITVWGHAKSYTAGFSHDYLLDVSTWRLSQP